jgi:formaldehyde-activating enzyme
VRAAGLRVGSGSAGEGRERAQIDLVAGRKDGPLGDVYAYQLTYPRYGYEALTTILEPNLTVRPSTLIVPTNELKDLRQANMVYGPTQSAVARAVVDKLVEGVIPERAMEDELLIAQAAVDPLALDRHALYKSVYKATAAAIDAAFGRERR